MSPGERNWWPQHGDSLFASGTDWESEAMVQVPWNSLLSYALGYKEAADCLVARVQARELTADLTIYPICFLYRHHIELMLKALIKLGGQLRDGRADYPKDHRIRQLWEACRPLLEHACPDGDRADTEIVENCISEFASLDPSGESFRYDEDRQGNPNFTKDFHLNLGNMRVVMNRLSGFLTGSYDYMSELLQYTDE